MERLNGALIVLDKFPDREVQRLDFVELSARGSTFNQWKMMGTLLWIHGKRAHLLSSPTPLWSWLIASFIAGSGKTVLWCADYHWALGLRY